jgi:hypothetical protein
MPLFWDCANEDVDRLEPGFRTDVQLLLSRSVWEWRVVYAFRSLQLQASLYEAYLAGGDRAAPPGKSPHNKGLAVDLQLWIRDTATAAKKMTWNVKSTGWQWLFDAVHRHPRLHSGIGFGDFDHVEKLNWKFYSNWNTAPEVAT